MHDVLTGLQVIDIDKICLHETHECMRLDKTCQAILEEGVLRNPPLAAKMRDGRYLILDGAHRTCSLRKIGCLRSVVQVVEEGQFMLSAWNHLVTAGDWLQELAAHPMLLLTEEPLAAAEPVAIILDSNGKSLHVYPSQDLEEPQSRLEAWHRVVAAYSSDQAVQRIAQGDLQLPPEGSALIRYPVATLDELDRIVSSGQVMPAGVTRCIVQGRLLNLRVPLSLLNTPEFAEQEWQQLCARWSHSLRLYSEAVYLCEA